MEHPLQQGKGDNELNDLQFMTSVDSSIPQNVPMPSQHPQPGVYSGQLSSPPVSGGSSMETTSTSTSITSEPYAGLEILKGSAHPVACIFHCVFKILSLFLYIFNGLFFTNNKGVNFITISVCCIMLLAADFWVVKNITGRLLVGLRWWNKVADDGTSTAWIFESAPETRTKNPVDHRIFWTVLYITPVVWSLLFISALLKFHLGWMITVIFAIVLSSANVYGYWKCSSDQKAKFQRMMAKGAEMGTMAMVRNNFFGLFNRPSAQATQVPARDRKSVV